MSREKKKEIRPHKDWVYLSGCEKLAAHQHADDYSKDIRDQDARLSGLDKLDKILIEKMGADPSIH